MRKGRRLLLFLALIITLGLWTYAKKSESAEMETEFELSCREIEMVTLKGAHAIEDLRDQYFSQSSKYDRMITATQFAGIKQMLELLLDAYEKKCQPSSTPPSPSQSDGRKLSV